LLLTASNDNLNRIDFGSQASEANRAALASFERDLGHAIVPPSGVSPVVFADPRACAFLSDVDADGVSELVAWVAYTVSNELERHVTQPIGGGSTPSTPGDFGMQGWNQVLTPNSRPSGMTVFDVTQVGAALKNLTDPDEDIAKYGHSFPVFSYAMDATRATTDPTKVGLITVHLRNGLPDNDSNIIDRTGAYRVIAYVINGY
jgi:hypothetical protein